MSELWTSGPLICFLSITFHVFCQVRIYILWNFSQYSLNRFMSIEYDITPKSSFILSKLEFSFTVTVLVLLWELLSDWPWPHDVMEYPPLDWRLVANKGLWMPMWLHTLRSGPQCIETDPESLPDLPESLIIPPVNHPCPLPANNMASPNDMIHHCTFVKTCFRCLWHGTDLVGEADGDLSMGLGEHWVLQL